MLVTVGGGGGGAVPAASWEGGGEGEWGVQPTGGLGRSGPAETTTKEGGSIAMWRVRRNFKPDRDRERRRGGKGRGRKRRQRVGRRD